ncbi:hypothetical protein [Pseudoroseomonas cervicalis]|uniref:hypothetical protein n=1 Tax=Teichococcus cervicalis TaxID=204525 RepID=UPI00278A44FC|nr:hypothetical protein [Pseudoroseomonas cervicalis]MDQ1078813.1 hypothetical protein [Pseudoroseomonas cervicalis]
MSDAVSEAATRLEQAVERLAAALARPVPPGAAQPQGVPPEAVAALSARLDDTLARLRTALAEVEAGEAAAAEADAAESEPEAGMGPAGMSKGS